MMIIRAVAAMLVALSLSRACGAEEPKKEVKILVDARPEYLKKDVPVVEYKQMVIPATITTETIPAVYRTLSDGTKQMVKREIQIQHPVPAVFETRSCKLILDEVNFKQLRAIAAKPARVQITGELVNGEMKVSAFKEVKEQGEPDQK